jgi:hypothetical protein
MKDSLFDIRLARNCFTAAGLDFGHYLRLAHVVDDESQPGRWNVSENFVNGRFVSEAILAMQAFFKSNNIEVQPLEWINLWTALRERKSFDVCPYTEEVFRTSVVTPRFDYGKRVVVLVFKSPTELNKELTNTLNEAIRGRCGNKWDNE